MVDVPQKKIKEERKKMFKKIKERMEKQKKAIVSALITCSLIAYNTAGVYATSGVSDNLSNASNGAQQEALSWIEAAGGFGIVVGALIWASRKWQRLLFSVLLLPIFWLSILRTFGVGLQVFFKREERNFLSFCL